VQGIFKWTKPGLVLLFCAATLLAQPVQTDYDHNFNLAKLRTYGFDKRQRSAGDALASNSINDRRIHDALENQLDENGFAASEQPDVIISYTVTTRKALDIQDNRFGPLVRAGFVNVNQITQGTLIVSFVDAATRKEVWRGYAAGEINPKNLDKDVNKAIAKLIKAFKNNQAGKK
jgi:Domain of unknown function (DUF4136)